MRISPFHLKRVLCIIESTLSLPLLLHLALFIFLFQVFLLARSSFFRLDMSNFGYSMGWSNNGRSSGSRKGKRGCGSGGADKPKQPQRGLGVAQLEKIRLQSEMAEYFHPLGQPPILIQRTGSLNLEDARAPTSSLSSSPSSSLHATAVSSPFPIHPNFVMTYGERGDARYSDFQTPIIRSPSSSAIYGTPHYAHPSVTLPLFAPEESARLKGHHDRSRSADSTIMNSDDPQDVDLELKL
ncbi:protein SPEAR3-like [Phragmites australis]|uniref:protein SPEAR3-like n=1 Tax=Phragmites australis TaxID=29695 RepID=UPI002D7955C2|nr:protein SPEAR3-like [Phragmites australis]